ncbi:MAG TPA: M13 family metallopeptidase [Candidatus Saccharimonadales bacterium]|nr:M13 family metallopeptidase [Candidatus Saccharimonadales bacterium]
MTTNTTSSTYSDRLDKAVRPQDDFFAYVNNKWLADNPIPDSETRWGSFSILHDEAQGHMRDIYEELQGQDSANGSLEQQIRDFYRSGMDFDKHKTGNLAVMDEYFDRIDSATNPTELIKVMGEVHRADVEGPWRMIVDADDRDSTSHILRIVQPRLTLPDRDYYLDEAEKMQSIREAYQKHARAMYAHFPALAASEDNFWDTVWEFELSFATVNRSRTALRDVQNNYHRVEYAELKDTYKNIDWDTYAKAVGWDTSSRISVDQPEVLQHVDDMISQKSLDQWKTYLKWQFLIKHGGRLSEELSNLRFEFFGKVLGGTTQIMPLWKRVAATIDAAMGEGSGKLYAERHFPESSKKQVLDIVEDIRAAYKERIQALDWMTEPTKEVALRKLANIKVLIGYPDKWRDFSDLEVKPDAYLRNVLNADALATDYWLGKLTQPTSRDDWFMNPQTVNAYHDPNRLVICFPGAILQPPFFSPDAPYAANVGSIGAVVGHEFTHGFDDQGCQFDEEGNVRTWQTDDERKAFAERAQKIIDQADNFEVLPGVHLKGQLVIGESIADLGGLELAHHAFLANVTDPAEKIDGDLTAQDVFFISFASTECGNSRDERKRELALSDPHPTEKFRVNAMVGNCDSFYETFDVSEKDALYLPPAARAKIW